MLQIARRTLLIVGMLALITGTACYRFELGSIWAEEPILVDGDDGEWTFPRKVLNGERSVIGFMNDDTYLYISFRTSNQSRIQQIINQGLTLWIDPRGGTNKWIGFRYPIGSKPLGISPWDYDSRPQTTGYQAFLDQILENQPGIELIGRKREDVALIPLDNPMGIQVRVRLTKDLFVYEMRVPYGKKSTLPSPIGAAPGKKIGIGLVEGPILEGGRNKRSSQNGGGMDEPGLSTGPAGQPPAGMYPTDRIAGEIWISVALASRR